MTSLLQINEHSIERVIRVLIGVAVLSLVFFGPKSAWGWLGILPILTGITGRCPLYAVLGFSTCPMKAAP